MTSRRAAQTTTMDACGWEYYRQFVEVLGAQLHQTSVNILWGFQYSMMWERIGCC